MAPRRVIPEELVAVVPAAPAPAVLGRSDARQAENSTSVDLGDEQLGPPAAQAPSAGGPCRRAARRALRFVACLCAWPCRCLSRCATVAVDDLVTAQYPVPFKIASGITVGLSVAWLTLYAVFVMPFAEFSLGDACGEYCTYIRYNTRFLLAYFLWFAIARLALCALLRRRSRSPCHVCCTAFFLRDGPLYMFVISSLLLCFHIAQVTVQEEAAAADYIDKVKIFAIVTNLLSFSCMLVVGWHTRLMTESVAAAQSSSTSRGMPPDMIKMLETLIYHEEHFGDEEGKRFPRECPICLGAFEEDDVVKVTPCEHAFHEECLANWFNVGRTCAICRMDLVAALAGGSQEPASEARTEREGEGEPPLEARAEREGAGER